MSKKVFIDAGAYTGQSVEHFKSHWSDWKEYEIYSFEPHPAHRPHFDRFKSNPKFNFSGKALWVHDGVVDFYLDPGYGGSTLMKEKKTGRMDTENPTRIPCIDTSAWIKDNFSKNDHIVLKMDTEGAEYETLNKLIEENTLEMVDELYIEFHNKKVRKSKKDDLILLGRMKKFTNLKVFYDKRSIWWGLERSTTRVGRWRDRRGWLTKRSLRRELDPLSPTHDKLLKILTTKEARSLLL